MGTPFATWFDETYRKEGEPRAQATARFQAATGLGHHTIYYALRGSRVQPAVARRIEAATDGAVLAADLVLAPTRSEIRNERDPSDPVPGAA